MALMHKTWPPIARNRVRGTFPECDPLRFTVDLFLVLSQFLVWACLKWRRLKQVVIGTRRGH